MEMKNINILKTIISLGIYVSTGIKLKGQLRAENI